MSVSCKLKKAIRSSRQIEKSHWVPPVLKIHTSAPAAVLDGELPPVAAELLSSAAAAVVRPLPLVNSPPCVLSLSLFPGHGGHGVRRRRPESQLLGAAAGVPAPGRGGRSPSPWPWRVVGGGPCSWVPAAPRAALLPWLGLACGVAGLRIETVAMAVQKGVAWVAARADSHGRAEEVAMATQRRWSWPLFFHWWMR